MKISKEIHVHAGHCVTSQVDSEGNPGKCAQGLHGHTYRIVATVDDKIIAEDKPSGGMVIDFGDLKKAMNDVIYKEADHASYLWEKDPAAEAFVAFGNSPGKNPKKHILVPFVPTAENLARYWFALLRNELTAVYNIHLYQIEVWETPTSCAVYTIDEYLTELGTIESMLSLVSKEEIE